MTMRSIIAEDAQSALPIPAISPHPRLDRVAAATFEQLSSALGIFVERGLAWRHYTGDGTTVGQQQIYDPGHTPVVTWRLSEDPQTQV
jgi:hypothetical protein